MIYVPFVPGGKKKRIVRARGRRWRRDTRNATRLPHLNRTAARRRLPCSEMLRRLQRLARCQQTNKRTSEQANKLRESERVTSISSPYPTSSTNADTPKQSSFSISLPLILHPLRHYRPLSLSLFLFVCVSVCLSLALFLSEFFVDIDDNRYLLNDPPDFFKFLSIFYVSNFLTRSSRYSPNFLLCSSFFYLFPTQRSNITMGRFLYRSTFFSFLKLVTRKYYREK